MQDTTWKPAVVLDLDDAKDSAMVETIEEFHEWSDTHPMVPTGLKDGWTTITAQVAENLLRHNKPGTNRKVSVKTVQYYGRQMKAGMWKRTGQPIILSDRDELLDSQHRCWAGYLSNTPFDSYVVTGVPHIDNIFAYIDNGKTRTSADALATAGLNGSAGIVSQVVTFARHYDANAFSVEGDTHLPKASPIEVLDYVAGHPSIRTAVHLQLAEFDKANELINHRGTAAFVAYKIFDGYGEEMLDAFMIHLGSDDLTLTDPVMLLRKRLLEDKDAKKPMKKSLKLGLITKAFNAWRLKEKLKRLNLKTDEKWPRFTDEQVDA